MDLSFVIPCYRSEKNLPTVVEDIRMAMQKRPSWSYEIILVNDSSPDRTFEVIREMAKEDSHIVGVDFAKNAGQPSALLAGFSLARGEYIMTSDDDGQTPVERVWDFMDKMQEGYDVVCAQYEQRVQPSGFRRFGSWMNERMLRILLKKPEDVNLSSFFLAKKFLIRELIRYQNPYPYMAGLLLRSTGKIGNVILEQRDRRSGNSGYTLKKLLSLWVNGFTAFSLVPLRAADVLGGVSSAIGFLWALIVIIRKIIHPEIAAGYSSTVAVQLILGGLILLVLGVIGEYIGRIYMCMNKEPQYVIREIIGERGREQIEG